jgi:hypothetical protein
VVLGPKLVIEGMEEIHKRFDRERARQREAPVLRPRLDQGG